MSAKTWLDPSTHTFDDTTGWPKAGTPVAGDVLIPTGRNGCKSDETLADGSDRCGDATIWALLLPSVLTGGPSS